MELSPLLRTHYGLSGDPLEPLIGGRVNRLWRCGDVVVKQYDLGRVPRASAERALQVQAAGAAAGLPMPAVQRTQAGELWVEHESGLLAVMDLATGERRQRGALSLAEAAELGDVVGRLHRLLRERQPAETAAPRAPQPAAIAQRWADLREQALAQPTRLPFDDLVVETADFAIAALAQAPTVDWGAQPWQLCHCDLHLDNLLFAPSGRISAVLDFDNLNPFWTTCEALMVWNLCLCADPAHPTLTLEAKAFFAAYQAAHPLPAAAWAQAPQAYWLCTLASTWPAGLRYQNPDSYQPDWTEIMAIRLGTARWLGERADTMAEWLFEEACDK